MQIGNQLVIPQREKDGKSMNLVDWPLFNCTLIAPTYTHPVIYFRTMKSAHNMGKKRDTAREETDVRGKTFNYIFHMCVEKRLWCPCPRLSN